LGSVSLFRASEACLRSFVVVVLLGLVVFVVEVLQEQVKDLYNFTGVHENERDGHGHDDHDDGDRDRVNDHDCDDGFHKDHMRKLD
jgi:hypothetical protein